MNPPHTEASAQVRIPAPPPPETSPHEPVARPWELELLISGAVVFSLLQMPGFVDGWMAGMEPHMGEASLPWLFVVYAYVKLILYTLISCFVLHLVMRAYWVGLIGLEAVFPHGARWDDSSYGPVMTEVYREKIGRLQPRIDAADRFCSILFPLAFTLVMLFFYSVALLVLGVGAAYGISRLLLGGDHFGIVLVGISAVAGGIPMVTWAIDRTLGARMDRDGRGRRLLRRASLTTFYMNAMPLYGTTFMTLTSNIRKGARLPVMYALLALLFGFFFVKDLLIDRGTLVSGDHQYLPDTEGAFGVNAGFYESQRKEGEVYDRLPSIQSDVVRDPYLKLFIPYVPARHGAAFAQQCAGVRPLSAGGVRREGDDVPDSAAVRDVLDCWTRLQPVALDGRPLRPEFRFYTHPETGIRGILAYIPVTGMSRGEHLLTVGLAPRVRETERKRGAPAREARSDPYYIRFWL